MDTNDTKPARKIIAAFGGINRTAKALEIPVSTVQGWHERGFIPSQRQWVVLNKARSLGLDITESDFIGKGEVAVHHVPTQEASNA